MKDLKVKRNIKIEFSYNGQEYYGLQKQKDKITVQGEIEKALKTLFGQDISINLAGRTDRGVSAQNMVANFFISFDIPVDKISFALNPLLPGNIRILKSCEVEKNFHARFSAKQKTYCYSLYSSQFELPLFPFETWVKFDLDFCKMKKAIKYLKGKQDFSSFVTNSKQYESLVRTIKKVKIEKKEIAGFNHYYFYFTGDGFMYNQVRNMVGTIVSVGLHKIKPIDMKKIILSKNRCNAGSCFPAKGLTLLSVEY